MSKHTLTAREILSHARIGACLHLINMPSLKEARTMLFSAGVIESTPKLLHSKSNIRTLAFPGDTANTQVIWYQQSVAQKHQGNTFRVRHTEMRYRAYYILDDLRLPFGLINVYSSVEADLMLYRLISILRA